MSTLEATFLDTSYDDDDDDEAPILVTVEEEDTGNVTPQSETKVCPVTILSGFLGSGKTTLVQFILNNEQHGKKIAVIENEYGGDNEDTAESQRQSLQIESLIARDGFNANNNLTDLLELPNGCVCCTVKDSLVATLEALLDRRPDLDYILIECSGLANPGPIASLFWLDDGISRLRLDGIVTLVDAVHIAQQLSSTFEASQQIAYADRILLNKMDLIATSKPPRLESNAVEGLIRSLNPTAPLQCTRYSAVPDLDWLLDANCFDSRKVQDIEDLLRKLEDDDVTEEKDEHYSDNHHHHHHHEHEHDCHDCQQHTSTYHRHTEAVSTITVVLRNSSVSLNKLDQWLAKLLWPHQDEQDGVLSKLLHDTADSNGRNSVPVHRSIRQDRDSMEIFRIKGMVSVAYDCDDPDLQSEEALHVEDGLDRRKFIVQGVHDLWEVHASKLEWTSDSERTCKLVFIGRNLGKVELEKGLTDCIIHCHTVTPLLR